MQFDVLRAITRWTFSQDGGGLVVFLGGGGRKCRSGKEIAQQGQARQAVAERQPRSFPLPAEPLSSDWVQLEPSFATQLAEVGVQREPRVMNQDTPISKA